MKTKILSLLLIVAIITGACKKDPDKGLTPETQTGANTFSCKINGETFVAKQDLFSPKAIFVAFYPGTDPYFILDGRNFSTRPYREIEIKILGNITLGTYKIGGNSSNIGSIEYRYPNNIYKTNMINSGEINFTKVDMSSGIYSGTFSFSCVDNNNQHIQIEKGRFDVKTQ